MGLRPVVFVPGTPHGRPGQVGRTWGARPIPLWFVYPSAEVWTFALAYVFVPGFQVFLDFGHEAAGVGSVDDAVIEAQG
jgi:hypothetical protein